MLIPAFREELCLGYANTLAWRGRPSPSDALGDLADLLRWAEQSAGLSAAAAREIRAWARDHPKPAAGLFAGSIEMREVISRIFSSVAAGERVPEEDFSALKHAIAAAPPRGTLARTGGGYGWQLPRPRPLPADILAPVLWSAGDLLLRIGDRRVRRCANEECLWLFIDESKNGTRRWCDMTSCGNRAKARRHYSKVRQG